MAGFAATVLATVSSGSALASAVGWSMTAHPIVSSCRTVGWHGGSPSGIYHTQYVPPPGVGAYLSDLPHGVMTICYYTYSGDQTSDGDYYLAEAQAQISTDSSTYSRDYSWPANTTFWVSSNIAPKDAVIAATPGDKSTSSCGRSFSVGVNLGIFSVSTDLQECSGYTISEGTYSNKQGADWYTGTSGEVQLMSGAYVQKVPHGSSPTFTIQFAVPTYTYTNLGLDPDGCANSYPGCYKYSISPSWTYYTYSVK